MTLVVGRMRHILVIFLLLGSAIASGQRRAPDPPAGPVPACPVLPGVTNVRIIGQAGPDFWLCTATHIGSGKKLFDVYVGNHPPGFGPGTRFGGTTAAHGKTLVWFVTPAGGRDKSTVWQTFLPTGDVRLSVMVVSFTTTGPAEVALDRMTPLIAHLQVGH